MSKILLLDFEENDLQRLQERKFDVELKQTNWRTGSTESLRPPQDCRIVFYQVNLNNEDPGLHAGDSAGFETVVKDGGAIVCFIGDCREFHLTNVIGDIPELKFEVNNLPDKITEIKDEPFSGLFLQFRPYISQAFELLAESNSLGQVIDFKDRETPASGEFLVLAESLRKRPVSVMIRKGKGFYLLLPWFGDKNADVAASVLETVLPEIAPHLTIKEEENWLDSYDYIFPGLLEAFKKMEEEIGRHRQAMRQLDDEIEDIRSTDQEPFNRLLTAEGKDLKRAVFNAFKHLEWPNVVDVNEYWKHVIRVPEEDIWLLDQEEQPLENLIREAPLKLVMVRDGTAGAKEEDCLLMQRVKGRRMQEFDNTKMKAILVGNYFAPTEAKLRGAAFTEAQINEGVQDGNGLLTTYELFKAIKAEKEGKISKETIRGQIADKVGLITFDY